MGMSSDRVAFPDNSIQKTLIAVSWWLPSTGSSWSRPVDHLPGHQRRKPGIHRVASGAKHGLEHVLCLTGRITTVQTMNPRLTTSPSPVQSFSDFMLVKHIGILDEGIRTSLT